MDVSSGDDRDGRHASRGAFCIGINRLGGASQGANPCLLEMTTDQSGASFKDRRARIKPPPPRWTESEETGKEEYGSKEE